MGKIIMRKDLKLKQWALCALFLLAEEVAEAGVFNVINYGAIADGKTDISKALISAWTASCKSSEPSNTVLIPKGTYLLGPVMLGNCKSPSIGLKIDGVVQAPPDPAVFNGDWIAFLYVKSLTIHGGGIIDGRGQQAWTNNRCAENPNCKPFPANIKLNYVDNAWIRDITSRNSKYFHIGIFQSSNVHIEHVALSAPPNSLNTDGIHISNSAGINITNARISTGDDCVSIGPGAQNIHVTKVICGPGHGISVGSLGKTNGREEVHGVSVSNCTFVNTQNGVRIKTWPSSPATGVASGIVFEDLIMVNVYNPIILDQQYCPHYHCNKQYGNTPSHIKIINTKFNMIRGTTPYQPAVIIACSSEQPCENLEIGDINLRYTGTGAAEAECSNVKPIFHGQQIPPIHCT